jgi:hypothetical protein
VLAPSSSLQLIKYMMFKGYPVRILSVLVGCFLCALVLGGCDNDTEETEEGRQVGGADSMVADMGTDSGGQTPPVGGQSCSDGIPVIQSGQWSELLGKPATAIEAVWTGNEFGLLWLASEASSGLRPLMFGRASASGALLGDPVLIGQASASSHRLVFTGVRYIVAWVNGRDGDDPYDGIRVGIVSPEGALAEITSEIDGTYNSAQLDLAWDEISGGLLTFTRGALGESGLFSVVINDDGTLSPENVVDAGNVSAFASTYGDGAWAVTYAVRDEEASDPVRLHLLDDDGAVYDPTPIEVGNRALGRIHIAYGQGNYAITWTGLNQEEKLLPMAVLLDGAAEIIGRPILNLNADFGVVEDLTVSAATGFIFSWHGELDLVPVLGIQVMSILGILETSVMMTVDPEEQYSQSRIILSENEQINVFSTNDPNPKALGYSEDVNIQQTRVEACD